MPRKTDSPKRLSRDRDRSMFVSQGRSVAESVRSIGVTQFTYSRRREAYDGLKTDEAKQLEQGTSGSTRQRRISRSRN
ncbi:hypothetical protein SAMN05421759_11386 [Roseivivax lentus]|uniref:Transposase n=1 Tax=Roseivivax lentus TaxID=633194 RepID=A0A1N7P8E8_9RHOB|nr:hypothetical protein SAMN05421759_11386 [Roseivivax lentus]